MWRLPEAGQVVVLKQENVQDHITDLRFIAQNVDHVIFPNDIPIIPGVWYFDLQECAILPEHIDWEETSPVEASQENGAEQESPARAVVVARVFPDVQL